MAVAVTHSTVQYSEHWCVGHPCHTRPVLAGAGCLREGLHYTVTTQWASVTAFAPNRVGLEALVTPHVLECENTPPLS